MANKVRYTRAEIQKELDERDKAGRAFTHFYKEIDRLTSPGTASAIICMVEAKLRMLGK